MTEEEFILHSASLGYSSKNQGEKWCAKHPKDNYTEEDLKSFFVGAKLAGKRTTAEFGTAFAVLKQRNATSTHTKCERNHVGG